MKLGSLSLIYGFFALLSLLLFLTYLLFDKRRKFLFLALFFCVASSNCGYFLLSVSDSLSLARFANGLSYFGGAFSLLVMLLIIYKVCKMERRLWVTWGLTCISVAIFALAASGDWLGLYYRSVSLATHSGSTYLVKDYGPLHGLYALYLAAYVGIVLLCIGYAAKTDRLASPRFTVILLVTVLLNVGVWLVGQIIREPFEFLSISYVVTEILLLLLYNMLWDYGIIQPNGVLSVQMLTQLNTRRLDPSALPAPMEELLSSFATRVCTLSSAERRILQYYIDGYDIGQIPDLAFVSIHTVKKHNRSIYQKLSIASRDELMLYIELFRRCDRLQELSGE